jgi:hypothetical protein
MRFKEKLFLLFLMLCNKSSLLCSQNQRLLAEGYLQKDIDRWSWTSFVKIRQNIQDVVYIDSRNYNNDQWAIPLFDRLEFLRLDEICKERPSEEERYYFQKEYISEGLRDILEKSKLGCRVTYTSGKSALVYYNLNKKYVLYIIQNKVKSLETR